MRLFLSITDAGDLGLTLLANPAWARSSTEQLAGHTRAEQGEFGLQFPAGLDTRQRRFWSD